MVKKEDPDKILVSGNTRTARATGVMGSTAPKSPITHPTTASVLIQPIPSSLQITTPASLASEFALLQTAFDKPETEHTWEQIDRSLKRFHAVVRGGGCKLSEDFIRGMRAKEFVLGFVRSMETERTRLSGTTLDLLSSITRLGPLFSPLLPLYLPRVLRLLCRTNKLYLQRASQTLSTIIRNTHLVDVLKYIVMEWKGEAGKSTSFRVGASEAIGVVLGLVEEEEKGGRIKDATERRMEELEWIVRIGATDKEQKVRAEIRKVWEVYKRVWPERVQAFTAPMTPVIRRYLNVPAVGGSTSTSTSSASSSLRPLAAHPPKPKAPTAHAPPPVASSASSLSRSTSARAPLATSTTTAAPKSHHLSKSVGHGASNSSSSTRVTVPFSLSTSTNRPPLPQVPTPVFPPPTSKVVPSLSASLSSRPLAVAPSLPPSTSLESDLPPRPLSVASTVSLSSRPFAPLHPKPALSSASASTTKAYRPIPPPYRTNPHPTLPGGEPFVRKKAQRCPLPLPPPPPPSAPILALNNAPLSASTARTTTTASAGTSGAPFRPKPSAAAVALARSGSHNSVLHSGQTQLLSQGGKRDANANANLMPVGGPPRSAARMGGTLGSKGGREGEKEKERERAVSAATLAVRERERKKRERGMTGVEKIVEVDEKKVQEGGSESLERGLEKLVTGERGEEGDGETQLERNIQLIEDVQVEDGERVEGDALVRMLEGLGMGENNNKEEDEQEEDEQDEEEKKKDVKEDENGHEDEAEDEGALLDELEPSSGGIGMDSVLLTAEPVLEEEEQKERLEIIEEPELEQEMEMEETEQETEQETEVEMEEDISGAGMRLVEEEAVEEEVIEEEEPVEEDNVEVEQMCPLVESAQPERVDDHPAPVATVIATSPIVSQEDNAPLVRQNSIPTPEDYEPAASHSPVEPDPEPEHDRTAQSISLNPIHFHTSTPFLSRSISRLPPPPVPTIPVAATISLPSSPTPNTEEEHVSSPLPPSPTFFRSSSSLPSTPIATCRPSISLPSLSPAPLSPESAQTCSIILDTPPRFTHERMTIRVRGKSVPELSAEVSDAEEEVEEEGETTPMAVFLRDEMGLDYEEGEDADETVEEGIEMDVPLNDVDDEDEDEEEEDAIGFDVDQYAPTVVLRGHFGLDDQTSDLEGLAEDLGDEGMGEGEPIEQPELIFHDDSDEEMEATVVEEEDEPEQAQEVVIIPTPEVEEPVLLKRSLRSRTVVVIEEGSRKTPAKTPARARDVLRTVQ